MLEQVFQNDSNTSVYAADGILGSASVRLTLGTGVCSAEHQQLRTECAVIAACSVRTGYVFFGTLVASCD